jgi:hypothetical protein
VWSFVRLLFLTRSSLNTVFYTEEFWDFWQNGEKVPHRKNSSPFWINCYKVSFYTGFWGTWGTGEPKKFLRLGGVAGGWALATPYIIIFIYKYKI